MVPDDNNAILDADLDAQQTAYWRYLAAVQVERDSFWWVLPKSLGTSVAAFALGGFWIAEILWNQLSTLLSFSSLSGFSEILAWFGLFESLWLIITVAWFGARFVQAKSQCRRKAVAEWVAVEMALRASGVVTQWPFPGWFRRSVDPETWSFLVATSNQRELLKADSRPSIPPADQISHERTRLGN